MTCTRHMHAYSGPLHLCACTSKMPCMSSLCACRTPCLARIYDALPLESRTGRVQLLVPQQLQPFASDPLLGSGRSSSMDAAAELDAAAAIAVAGRQGMGSGKGHSAATAGRSAGGPACVVHLAATGDHTFSRRLKLGFPLLSDVSWPVLGTYLDAFACHGSGPACVHARG